jgi:hypothetical protein
MAHQFSLFMGAVPPAERDITLDATVTDWIANGLVIAERHLPYGELMGEEFKRLPVSQPGDPSWWGQLVREALRVGIIRPTERFEKAEGRRNHGHRYRVYVRGRM